MQNTDLPHIVKEAVNGPHAVLCFYTPPMDAQLTKACVRAAGAYNAFAPTEINRVIDEIAGLDANVQFVLARELSMALYVYQSSVPVEQLIHLLQPTRPDELDAIQDMPFELPTRPIVRAWWD